MTHAHTNCSGCKASTTSTTNTVLLLIILPILGWLCYETNNIDQRISRLEGSRGIHNAQNPASGGHPKGTAI